MWMLNREFKKEDGYLWWSRSLFFSLIISSLYYLYYRQVTDFTCIGGILRSGRAGGEERKCGFPDKKLLYLL